MKIIFLDCDGVLNIPTTPHLGIIGALEHSLVKIIKDILEKTDAKIVLSSSWRRIQYWPSVMLAAGFDINCFLGATPQNNGLTSRGTEIKQWLEGYQKSSEIEKFCCIDDNGDFLEGQKLFKTDPLIGITKEIGEEIVTYLNSK